MHEINVTPFIHVMLVLLISFTVAAPSATVDVKVNLACLHQHAAAASGRPGNLSVKSDKSMFIGTIR
ncbi:biopolymer transporter ExbD [Shigella flexneri]